MPEYTPILVMICFCNECYTQWVIPEEHEDSSQSKGCPRCTNCYNTEWGLDWEWELKDYS